MQYINTQPPLIKRETTPRRSRRSWFKVVLKYLKIISVGVVLVAVAGFVFIKLDTSAAAEFTDTYLRPILGDIQVIFLEKIFFNASDKANQLKYTVVQPT